MLTTPDIAYAARPDTTPEAELSTLATVYRFVLEGRTKKEAAPRQSRPDAEKGSKRDSRPLQSTL
jgi:hypothetical protein